jgi:Uma2 family endonuclease
VHFEIRFLVLIIAPGVLVDMCHLVVRQRTFDPGRQSHHEAALGNDHSLGDEGVGANDAMSPDLRVIEDGRAHTDQTIRPDLAAMQHDAMADRDVVVENEGVLILHHVKDASILDVGVFPDPDVVYVTANDGVEPDARMIADLDIPDDNRPFSDEDPLSQLWQLPFVVQQHKSKRTTLTEAPLGIQGTGARSRGKVDKEIAESPEIPPGFPRQARRISVFCVAPELRYAHGAMSKLIKRRLFTVHDYHRMGDAGILRAEDRVELIYGEIITMSPTGNPHNAAVDRATRAFIHAAGDTAIVRVQGSVRLNLYNEPEPDFALLKPKDDFYAKAGAGPADVLLIVEMAASSLKYDRKVKVRLYADMGIPEYWVVDLEGECVYAYSDRHEKSYRLVRQFRRGEILAPELLPDCRIPVENLLP